MRVHLHDDWYAPFTQSLNFGSPEARLWVPSRRRGVRPVCHPLPVYQLTTFSDYQVVTLFNQLCLGTDPTFRDCKRGYRTIGVSIAFTLNHDSITPLKYQSNYVARFNRPTLEQWYNHRHVIVHPKHSIEARAYLRIPDQESQPVVPGRNQRAPPQVQQCRG